jgi:hypothetical protein
VINSAAVSLRENASDLHMDNMRAQAARLAIEARFHENGNDIANSPTTKDMSKIAEQKLAKSKDLRKRAALAGLKARKRRLDRTR